MGAQRFFQFLLLLGTGLCIMGTFLFFQQGEIPLVCGRGLIAQNTNTYLGPNERLPEGPSLVRVQVLVYNDPNPKGAKIVKASFAGASIPLKPRDIYGYRGQASFQKSPGKYKLKWTVEIDDKNWPKTVDHEEEVILDERDFWVQISIIGSAAAIS
ncbi:MAG: hypothetical protein KGQ49_02625 [Verrucomicrobia bacterium]|nr:hypothetical protein [Verrucomicrobiota bacterium]MBU6446277.1 hypothetical protein [Verrucomicrobiota bacterium]MDE3047458.1 hypothetical protein [Verrucomicrobiota bacterium]